MKIFDVVIIGAGVIGLSIAKSISEKGQSVIVLEKNGRAGEGVSSRNSGVIHAGMYYPTNSMKAKFCVEGNRLLYEYADLKKITHSKTGKYIIASRKEEISKLKKIYEQGLINGVSLKKFKGKDINKNEPALNVEAGLLSAETGIIDVPELITALEGDIQHNEGIISFNTEFISAKKKSGLFSIICRDKEKFEIQSKILINSSALSSDLVSRNIKSLEEKYIYKINYAKGHYFKYSGHNPFTSLIYPLPDEFSQGLHLGFDMSRQLRFGPDITWVKEINYLFDESLKEKFIKAIHNYWPEMNPEKLNPDYTGVRPKIQNSKGKMQDFSILEANSHGVDGLINLQGMESPGLTSSLAIGNYVASRV